MTTETPQHVLGRQVAYPDHYAPEILVRVDRAGNREAHAIDTHNLPFTGYDLWNAYEVSALTRNGAPVNLIMRLRYPCESRYIVESKSLKLYLNAFNMTRLDATPDEVACTVARTVERDLSALLETRVEAIVETPRRAAAHTLTSPEAPDSAPTAWACWDAQRPERRPTHRLQGGTGPAARRRCRIRCAARHDRPAAQPLQNHLTTRLGRPLPLYAGQPPALGRLAAALHRLVPRREPLPRRGGRDDISHSVDKVCPRRAAGHGLLRTPGWHRHQPGTGQPHRTADPLLSTHHGI